MSEEAVQTAETAEEKSAVVKEEVNEEQAELAVETESSVEPEASAGSEETTAETEPPAAFAEPLAEPATSEDLSYQAVEKEGTVTAIWEMQGRKHMRTIDPRSIEGKQILALFETAG